MRETRTVGEIKRDTMRESYLQHHKDMKPFLKKTERGNYPVVGMNLIWSSTFVAPLAEYDWVMDQIDRGPAAVDLNVGKSVYQVAVKQNASTYGLMRPTYHDTIRMLQNVVKELDQCGFELTDEVRERYLD